LSSLLSLNPLANSSTRNTLKTPIGFSFAAAVTIVVMKKKNKFLTWRLKLILALGCLGGLTLAISARYVESLSDTPLGPTPLSWTFKSSRASVVTAFAEESVMKNEEHPIEPVVPAIDQVLHEETEHALFALG
jgi:hypothetical protein